MASPENKRSVLKRSVQRRLCVKAPQPGMFCSVSSCSDPFCLLLPPSCPPRVSFSELVPPGLVSTTLLSHLLLLPLAAGGVPLRPGWQQGGEPELLSRAGPTHFGPLWSGADGRSQSGARRLGGRRPRLRRTCRGGGCVGKSGGAAAGLLNFTPLCFYVCCL